VVEEQLQNKDAPVIEYHAQIDTQSPRCLLGGGRIVHAWQWQQADANLGLHGAHAWWDSMDLAYAVQEIGAWWRSALTVEG